MLAYPQTASPGANAPDWTAAHCRYVKWWIRGSIRGIELPDTACVLVWLRGLWFNQLRHLPQGRLGPQQLSLEPLAGWPTTLQQIMEVSHMMSTADRDQLLLGRFDSTKVHAKLLADAVRVCIFACTRTESSEKKMIGVLEKMLESLMLKHPRLDADAESTTASTTSRRS